MTPAPTRAGEGRGELWALLVIAAPLAATQLSQLAMSLIASFALGRISSTAFAAGGICAIIIQMVTVVSQGLLAGVQPLLAADRGARAAGLAHAGMGAKGFAGAYGLALVLALLAVLALTNLGPLLTLFHLDPGVVASATAFAGPAAWSLPSVLLLAPLRFHLAVEGRAWVIMLAAGLGIPAYSGLLALLVFGPADLGIAGAGIALALTWWLIAGLVALYVWLSRLLPEGLSGLRLVDALVGARAVFTIGWPIALIYAAELGLTTALALLLGGFGTIAMAAHQVTHSINALAFMPAVALSQAVTVRVAYHMGAGRAEAARSAGYLAMGFVAIKMIVLGLLVVLFSDQVTLAFVGSDPDAAAIAALTRMLNVVLALFLVFDGLQTVASGALRGLKDTRIPMLIGIFAYWLVGFPIAVIAAFPLGLGPSGIWLGILAGISTAACLLIYRWHNRIRSRLEQGQGPADSPLQSASA